MDCDSTASMDGTLYCCSVDCDYAWMETWSKNVVFSHLWRSEDGFSVSERRDRRSRLEETEKPSELSKRCEKHILIQADDLRGLRDLREGEYVFPVRQQEKRILPP